MHILDIVQNAIAAEASKIEILIKEDLSENVFKIKIIDNGKGIARDKLEQITDPFTTSRTTRPVGMGLPLFKEAAKRCAGDLLIDSNLGQGTEITVFFEHDHIDRAPMGDIKETLLSLISLNPEIDFFYEHYYNNQRFYFDTEEIKEELDDVEINQREVLNWIREYIEEGLKEIYGGD